jgi:hypothetical protein
MTHPILRVVCILASLILLCCGLHYTNLMSKGPLRLVFRSLIVISTVAGVYLSLRASIPNPWTEILTILILLSSVYRVKHRRTNDHSPRMLNLQRGGVKIFL